MVEFDADPEYCICYQLKYTVFSILVAQIILPQNVENKAGYILHVRI